ncbi:lipopolysaccharide heptosyltransferase II [Chthonobacter albigriseus]|uniref:lipopolysaccharide heptosyltransferase II n=1 Tax=Chthonobacter albigriseus TaxID=1683161 RepID=UPI0015EF5C84|nr:lipopolysaccharide heptosyltransferase II [Chthonobacter albigriseus]
MAEERAILVIGPSWVGDMVMAQCLFRALKDRDPDAAIDVVAPAWAAPLLARMPEVRASLPAPVGRGRFGLVDRFRAGRALRGRYTDAYVMPGSWKSALMPFFAGISQRVGYLKEFRYGLLNDIVPLPPELKRKTAQTYFRLARGGRFVPPRLTVDAANQQTLLARHGLSEGGYVAIMPGAEYGPAKRWPADKYAALARAMADRGLDTVIFGSANDKPVSAEILALAPAAIDLCGQTRLEDAVDLIAGARFAVSNDSGLMHVAAAVGRPVVAVYGSTSPQNTPPLGEHVEVVTLALACSPCHEKICPLGHLNCLVQLDVPRVVAAADRLLAAGPGP